MSSEDDYDDFLNFMDLQKKKLKLKYVDKSEKKREDMLIKEFIVDDDSILIEHSSESNDSSADECNKEKKSQINKSFSSIFSSDDDNSIENDSNAAEMISPEIEMSNSNLTNQQELASLFSENSCSNIENVSSESSNSSHNSIAFKTPSALKHYSVHLRTPKNNSNPESVQNKASIDITDNSIFDSENPNKILDVFKTPSLIKTNNSEKVKSNQNLNSYSEVSGSSALKIPGLKNNFDNNLKDKEKCNENNKENICVTPKNRRAVVKCLKSLSVKKPRKLQRYSRLREISDSDDGSDNDCSADVSFIDDSIILSDNGLIEYGIHSSEELSDNNSFAEDSFSSSEENIDISQRLGYFTPQNSNKLPKLVMKTAPSMRSSDKLDFISSLLDHVDEHKRDEEAIMFRKMFNSKKEELSKKIYNIYNEMAFNNQLPEQIDICWDVRLRKTAGQCCYFKSRNNPEIHSLKIKLSVKILTNTDRLLKTLVHEMCHGACWIIDNISGHHGPLWKAWTVKAYKAFPNVPISSRSHNYEIHYKFEYWCQACNIAAAKRHSKSLGDGNVCGRCKGKLVLYRISKAGEKILVDEKKTTNAYREFVKLNYGKHRKPGTTHKQAMQKLAEEYKSIANSTKNELSDMLNKIKLS